MYTRIPPWSPGPTHPFPRSLPFLLYPLRPLLAFPPKVHRLIAAIPLAFFPCPPVKNAFSDHGNGQGNSLMNQSWLMRVKGGCTLSKISLQIVLLLRVYVLLLHGNINIKRRYKSLSVPIPPLIPLCDIPSLVSNHQSLHSLFVLISLYFPTLLSSCYILCLHL